MGRSGSGIHISEERVCPGAFLVQVKGRLGWDTKACWTTETDNEYLLWVDSCPRWWLHSPPVFVATRCSCHTSIALISLLPLPLSLVFVVRLVPVPTLSVLPPRRTPTYQSPSPIHSHFYPWIALPVGFFNPKSFLGAYPTINVDETTFGCPVFGVRFSSGP